MKAYIITTRDKHGRAADLTHYPDSLPEPELYYGVTPDDIETPEWWIEAHKKHKDNIPERVYCCNMSKVKLLQKHVDQYGAEDVLMMEDDVIFKPGAGEKYKAFRDNLPENWGMQYLGGWHEFSNQRNLTPIEAAPGVLKCNNVLGSEAVIIRGELVTEAIECLTITPEHDYYICDWQLVTMQRRHYAYSPIEMIAKQQSGYSLLWQKQRDWREHHHYFVGLDRKLYYI